MAEVVLSNIGKIYPRNVSAISNLHLEIEDGEFAVLSGPAGSGKSTVLRMIAGLEQPSSGTISIDGKVVKDSTPADRSVAMVFQRPSLYQHMTVYNNIAFSLKLRKSTGDAADNRVKNIAELLGITELLGRRPGTLSREQILRVALCRALVKKPALLLIDDSLSGLDTKDRLNLRKEIKRLHHLLAATILYAASDPADALASGDRIAVINAGLLQQTADPLTLYNSPANIFVAGFIGHPQMNFFEGRIAYDEGRLLFNHRTFSIPLPELPASSMQQCSGKTVILGIRPEDITTEHLPGASPASIQASVETAEVMGRHTQLHLQTQNTAFTAVVESSHQYSIGHTIRLVLNMSKAHFFDKKSGRNILHKAAAQSGV